MRWIHISQTKPALSARRPLERLSVGSEMKVTEEIMRLSLQLCAGKAWPPVCCHTRSNSLLLPPRSQGGRGTCGETHGAGRERAGRSAVMCLQPRSLTTPEMWCAGWKDDYCGYKHLECAAVCSGATQRGDLGVNLWWKWVFWATSEEQRSWLSHWRSDGDRRDWWQLLKPDIPQEEQVSFTSREKSNKKKQLLDFGCMLWIISASLRGRKWI